MAARGESRRKPAVKSFLERMRPALPGGKASDIRAFQTDLAGRARADGCAGALSGLFASNKALAPFLGAVAGAAPFLRGLMLDDPARLIGLLEDDPDRRIAALCKRIAGGWQKTDEERLMADLRQGRSEAALLIALADLAGVWDVDSVTAALSAFADAALGAAVSFILAEAHAEGRLRLPTPGTPEKGSGWIILAMGKFGAGELNYSSDIDLIVFYDLDTAPLADDVEAAPQFVRMTRRLVHLLSEHTVDGYVFRTDLRLRPDPGSTAVAISTEAALHYYESFGQNWERAALIKARAAAGDRVAGAAFLGDIGPYIWRKYLDYAAIADIHSIKRQIHDHRGHAAITVAGHNIKLGRGGIREIEFFVQTQQLIAGGRNPALRTRATIATLAVLARAGWIEKQTAADLAAAYRFLRNLEHRLQMIADEQTHTLPEDDDGLLVVARLAGFKSVAALSKAVLATLATVRGHYNGLFETAPSLSHQIGNLVFTGDDDDPETLKTLRELGYEHPEEVSQAVRGWHYGRYPATRSASARERLTEFVPALLAAIADTENPDTTFAAFDRFVARLPTGLQLFALLGSHSELLKLLLTLLATAPRLTDVVIRRAHALDAVIEPAFFGVLPGPAVLKQRLDLTLGQANGYEDALDRARTFAGEQSLLVGVRVIAGAIGAGRAGSAYSDLADLLLAALLDLVQAEFKRQHGAMKGGKVALIAMGRLGGREMTAASDLDLILLYDFPDKVTGSSGKRPLAGGQYYARLTQRLVSALSAPTAEGTLYEVDFRLRPSGHSGPLATAIAAFAKYQEKDAWTWEHMALTRARVVAGDPPFVKQAAKEIAKVLTRRRDRRKLAADIVEMRKLLEEEKGADDIWNLKQARGGLVDIEFIAQYLQLAHAARHPGILSTTTATALTNAAQLGLLSASDADILLPALRLFQNLSQLVRFCVDEPFDPETAPRDLRQLLAKTADLPDFNHLEAHMRTSQATVRGVFERIVGGL